MENLNDTQQILNYVVELEDGQILQNLQNIITTADSNENTMFSLLKSWGLENLYEHLLGKLNKYLNNLLCKIIFKNKF